MSGGTSSVREGGMNDFGYDPFDNLSDDPTDNFIILEKHFRDERDDALKNADREDRTDVIYVAYISQVLGAIQELGLETEFRSEVPSIEDVSFNTYLNFNKDVLHYLTMLRVRRSQRKKGYSVEFDAASRSKMHHHLDQILEIFNALDVGDSKREKLISRLYDLRNEIDQPRTRFDRFAALAIDVSGLMGDVVERSKVIEILDSIGRVLWGAQTEKQKQLPPPTSPKRIEPPRPKIEPRKRPSSDMDDDIPF
jgi:hypothetical protein